MHEDIGYRGIDVYIFVDVIMFLCMHVSLFLYPQSSRELMSERTCRRSRLLVYALIRSWQPCIWMTVSGCNHNHCFAQRGSWSRGPGQTWVGGQFHWQVAAKWINYHRSNARPFQPACPRSREGEDTRMLKANGMANSFCRTANANDVSSDGTTGLWQMQTLTYSKTETHRFPPVQPLP